MLKGYEILEKIYSSKLSRIFRAVELSRKRPVILKMLSPHTPSSLEAASLEREFHLLKGISSPYVVEPLAYLKAMDGRNVLVMEDIGGCDIMNLKLPEEMTQAWLELAIKIAQGIKAIHAAHIIHKDICPQNIIFNTQSRELRIIDFSIATRLARENQQINNKGVLEGSLPYMSPEQTGRMNRFLDYRSDYYSFGATLFQLATGEPLFKANDALSYVSAHISRQSPHLEDIRPQLSLFIGDIIDILTQKRAEDRYQSAAGIIHDLKQAQERLQNKDLSTRFVLRTSDVSTSFAIPQKLFGREKQVAFLFQKFDFTASGGKSILIVRGPAGIGKSALIREVHRKIAGKRGFFVTGKFDQYARHMPYSALIQALADAIDQAMQLPAEEFARLKKRIEKQLGGNGGVIANLIPRVCAIIGEPPFLPLVGPQESQTRTLNTLVDFIQAFSDQNHPMVMFLDDMQWTDRPTLECLESIFQKKRVSHFLMLVSYRDNEVLDHHPLALSLEKIAKSAELCAIDLGPLAQDEVRQMVEETLKRSDAETSLLAQILYQQTGGNPFFMEETLGKLVRRNALSFDHEKARWTIDLRAAKELGASSNIVAFLLEKMSCLSDEAKSLIKVASCLGNHFLFSLIQLVMGHPPRSTIQTIEELVTEGFIVPLDNKYQLLLHRMDASFDTLWEFETLFMFQHDRVQQAAYDLFDGGEREVRHLDIARILMANRERIKMEQAEIARHFNEAIALIMDPDERMRVARLNVEAGQRAQHATAIKPAENYMEMARSLLPEDPWRTCPDMMYEISLARAEIAFQLGSWEKAEAMISEILAHTHDFKKRIEVMTTRCVHLNAGGRLQESIDTATDTLRILGHSIPRKPTLWHVATELFRARLIQGWRTPQDLLRQKEMVDFKQIMAIKNLSIMTISAFIFGQEHLYILGFLKMAAITMRYGNGKNAAFAYGAYSVVMTCALRKMKVGRAFAEIATKFDAISSDPSAKSRAAMGFACMSHLWHFSQKEQKSWLEEALHLSYQVGNSFDRAVNALNYPYAQIDIDYQEMRDINLKMMQILEECGISVFLDTGTMQNGRLNNFLGLTPSTYSYSYEGFSESAARKKAMHIRNFNGLAGLLTTKVEILVMREKWRAAAAYACAADRYLTALLGTRYEMMFRFYKVLALTQRVEALRFWRRGWMHVQILWQWAVMRRWYHHNPSSFSYLFALVDAEVSALYGRDQLQTAKKFENAIADAAAFSRLQPAVACQRAAIFARKHGLTSLATQYLHDAILHYEQCKGHGVAQFLQKKYHLDPRDAAGERVNAGEKSTRDHSFAGDPSVSRARLNIEALFSAHKALSNQLDIAGITKILLDQLMKNTGATRALFVLVEADGEFITGERRGEATNHIDGIRLLKEVADIPRDVIAYVLRSQRTIVLDDLASGNDFVHDAYLNNAGIRALLVVPVVHNARLGGVIYLENSTVAHTFTGDRCHFVELLSMQAAVAIEHARIYRDLKTLEGQHSQTIKSMLRHIELGILSLYGKDLKIHHEYSTYLETILGKKLLANIPVFTALFDASDLTSAQKDALRGRLLLILGQNYLTFQMNCGGLPTGIVYRHEGGEKFLSLQWGVIQNSCQTVERLVLSIRDETGERKLQSAAAKQGRQLALINQIIAIPEERLWGAFALIERDLKECHRLLENSGVQVIREVFLKAHTLKGVASSLKLIPILDGLHNLEQCCEDFQKDNAPFDDVAANDCILGLLQLVEELRVIAIKKLGGQTDNRTEQMWLNIEQCVLDCMRDDRSSIDACIKACISMLSADVPATQKGDFWRKRNAAGI